MKKILTIFAITIMVALSSNAQRSFSSNSSDPNIAPTLSVGAELGLPTGDLSNAWKTGFGVSAKYAHPLGENSAITGSVGYVSFSGKDGIPAWNMIPVKVGYRYFLTGSNFNIEPQLGYTFGSVSGSSSSDASAFTWAVGAGYFITPNIDLGLRYESLNKNGNSANFVGFRIAYNFSLGSR